MSSDLVKQLRGSERLIRLDCLFDGNAGCACSHCEASDTIARLAAERDAAEARAKREREIADAEEVRRVAAEARAERLRVALDKAGKFIADQFATDEDEDNGEWLAKDAREIYATLCKALEDDKQ